MRVFVGVAVGALGALGIVSSGISAGSFLALGLAIVLLYPYATRTKNPTKKHPSE